MPWKPLDGSDPFPTLGWDVLDWVTDNLTVVDGPTAGDPLVFTQEQANFVLRLYEVDPLFEGPATRDGEKHLRRGRIVRRALLSRPKGSGKLERLSNKIATPSGWTTIGDIRPGDELFGGDGSIVHCLAVHPVQQTDAWTVTLSDGTSAIFGGSHLFDVDVFIAGKKRVRKTLSVREMRDIGLVYPRPLTAGKTKATKGGVSRFALPPQPVLQMPDVPLGMDPYVLGLWLGDGNSDGSGITTHVDDANAYREALEGAGYELGSQRVTGNRWACYIRRGAFRDDLSRLGVLGDKHVPAEYLRAGVEQRRALLQGLMDSDGHADPSNRACEYVTVRKEMAYQIAELIRTLGIRVTVKESDAKLYGRVTGKRYRLCFTAYEHDRVFRLPRKCAVVKPQGRLAIPRTIAAIEPAPDTPMRCITVSATDGLYLTGETLWTTHNSPLAAALCLFEALGDAVLDGWDANGQPVGRPWADMGFKPMVQITGVSEEATVNTWGPCLDMARSGPVYDNYPIDPMQTFINVPRGRIEAVTSAGISREGFRPVWTVMDQALALDTPIPSPDGWRAMGDLEAGDFVYGSGGRAVRVSEAKPVSSGHDCYRVTFADGTSVVASAGHLWVSRQASSSGAGRVRRTDEMLDGHTYRIPAASPHANGEGWVSIRSIDPVDRVPVRCIAVESDDHLFACGEGGHYTHNTESWIQSNGGIRLARTIRRNTAKTGGATLETPNAFEPGEDSVAEASWNAHQAHLKGKAMTLKRDLLLDHREAPATTDIWDRESLRAGLVFAYGDSASDNGGWVNIDGVIDEFWDENTDTQEARRYFLNQITHASDSFLSAPELGACVEPKPVAMGSAIVLGFDGSMGRAKGKADATALVACRVDDGYCWQVLIREPPNNVKDARNWTAPVFEFDIAVQQMFRDFKVIGFYADPSGWEAHVARWEEQFGRKLKVKAGGDNGHPIMAWPRGKTTSVVPYVKRVKASILASGQARTSALAMALGDKTAMVGVGEFTYDGSMELTQHLLNARMRKTPSGFLLAKDFPESPKKIDGAYALVLAWKARLDALARGFDRAREARSPVVTLG